MEMRKYLVLASFLLFGCSPGSDHPESTSPRSLPSPAAVGASLPRLSAAPDGEVWLSWVEPRQEAKYALMYSISQADGWSAPKTVIEGGPWFVNWADFPSVVPLGGGRVAAHWLAKKPGGVYAYDVAMAVSTTGGDIWSEILSPHTDGTATEHGFVSIFPVGEEVGVVWLDGRNMKPATDASAGEHGHGGGMTLRYGRLDMTGAIVAEALLDDLTCDCCQTGASVTPAGPLIVYRDRDNDEIRDIYVTTLDDGRWSDPAPVAEDNWQIAACPVNGPFADAMGPGVVLAWFTAAGDKPTVRVAFSEDSGASFATPIDIDAGRVLGRVGAVLLDDGSAVVSWLAAQDEGAAEIRFRRVDAALGAGPSQVVASVPGARSSGFPQMRKGGDGLIFAWTVPGEPSRIETATTKIPLPPG